MSIGWRTEGTHTNTTHDNKTNELFLSVYAWFLSFVPDIYKHKGEGMNVMTKM